ncbi:hypothetical protein MWN33_13425 [Starkeya koreensis]|uniref:Lysozyme inhibitor LprI N-terminal domain-containing protein n=1 Tax=Ancylobacter koreensis TaxID=266121 RepID=A0ABT0DP22_9HYPH|nr:hypothetical protein [Ancylobacter koreensis]MCK0209032.1 hypothetical protein [Ancylobacter koreensis]
MLFLGAGAAVAGDMSLYKHVPTTRLDVRECTYEDAGAVQASCKYIEVGSIDGWLTSQQEDELKLVGLDKYWNNAGTYLKFAGTACARGDTSQGARDVAMGRGKELVKALIEAFEQDKLTEEMRKHASYREVDGGWHCVDTPNTREAQAPRDPFEMSEEHLGGFAEVMAQEEREREESRRAAERARTATFILHNDDRYTVGLQFFSKSRRHFWPAADRQYRLAVEETYRLSCQPGEKICLGAWRDGQTRQWGVGRDGRSGCENCCTTCGNTLETRLNDAGEDAYPQTSGGGGGGSVVNDLGNIITGVGLGIDIFNTLNGGGGGGGGGGGYSPPPPTPRGRDYRPSGISR